MRARLLQQGFALYCDIWTDQFPGMVQIVQLALPWAAGRSNPPALRWCSSRPWAWVARPWWRVG